MTCCLEEALLAALRDLEGTPIPSGNHFVGRKKCTDCVPYLVAKFTVVSGLRTSEGAQKRNQVSVSAYFSGDKQNQLIDYRSLIEEMFFGKTCVDFGDCGCFCLQGPLRISDDYTAGNLIRLQFSFEGLYKQLVGSESA